MTFQTAGEKAFKTEIVSVTTRPFYIPKYFHLAFNERVELCEQKPTKLKCSCKFINETSRYLWYEEWQNNDSFSKKLRQQGVRIKEKFMDL